MSFRSWLVRQGDHFGGIVHEVLSDSSFYRKNGEWFEPYKELLGFLAAVSK